MNSTGKMRIAIAALIIILTCGSSEARRWHGRCRPYRVITVTPRPVVTTQINNRFTQKERFAMAVAYLNSHDYLTIKKYARMTKLPKATAEAELDAFAMARNKPIVAALKGNKKVYVKE